MWYSVDTGFILMPRFCSRICTSVRRTLSVAMLPTCKIRARSTGGELEGLKAQTCYGCSTPHYCHPIAMATTRQSTAA